MSNLPAPLEPRRDLPLGTAAWHQFTANKIPHFKPGDFWLSRLPSGEAIGINDDRHVLIAGGTRGGKGTCFIIPNLCAWLGSVAVIDPKGENAMVTARRRGNGSVYCEGLGQKVYLLDPFRASATEADDLEDLRAAFNPLAELSVDCEETIDAAARIAEANIVSESASDPFWPNSSQGFYRELILHVVSSTDYQEHERNLNTVRRLLKVGEADIKAMLEADGEECPLSGLDILFAHMKRNRAFNGLVSDAGHRFARMCNEAPRMFESLIQTAITDTNYMDSPAMQRCLSRSDFRLSDLKTDPKGISLFITLPERYMRTHFGFLRMLTSLITAEMERVPGRPATGHRVLMVLDEFASLKRMRSMESAVAQIAGFGVKLVIAVQYLGQLKAEYKDNWETFIANCGTKLFFNNDDQMTREFVSKSIGDCEVLRTTHNHSTGASLSEGHSTGITSGRSWSTSYNGQSLSTTSGYSSGYSATHSESFGESWSKGETESVHKRALVDPSEVGRIFGNPETPSALALISGYQPIMLRRTSYFSEFMWAGYYDRHRDHPAPMRLVEVRGKRKADRLAVEAATRMRQAAIDAAVRAKRQSEEKTLREAAEELRRLQQRRSIRRWALAFAVYFVCVVYACRFLPDRTLEPVRAFVGYHVPSAPDEDPNVGIALQRQFGPEYEYAAAALRKLQSRDGKAHRKEKQRPGLQASKAGIFTQLFADK